MNTAAHVLLGTYFTCLALLSLFSAHRFIMLYYFYTRRPRAVAPPPLGDPAPLVTIQLPLFNERMVVERLLDSVAQIDYPRDRLQIQVLDDSTDDCNEVARAGVEHLAAMGFDVEFIHRENRHGYKAGALRNGLETARGEFIAIFDADFLIPPDFLRQSMPRFDAPDVGMVQLRWDHINRSYSLLTRLQSIMLDGHFVIEHAARHFSGRFFNFNGTAGVWRRAAIEDSGGWQHDTLTEDLDLSYRAQLRGWRFIYVPAATAPAELPVEINAFKTQQHRWTKGSIQTAIKLLPAVWRSRQPFKVKVEATFHLVNNLAYLLMLFLSLMMLPVVMVRQELNIPVPFWIDLILFVLATVSIAAFYAASQREVLPRWWRQMAYIPLMMSLGIGLCVNNARAVLEALFGVKSGFVRTPKFAVEKRGDSWKRNPYISARAGVAFVEIVLAGYYAVIVAYCLANSNYYSLPFMLLFLFGFSYVGVLSVQTTLRRTSAP